MTSRSILCSIITSLTILILSPFTAHARPLYYSCLVEVYPELQAPTAKIKCAVCHPGKSKKKRNEYGKRLAKELRAKNVRNRKKISDALRKIGPPKLVNAASVETNATRVDRLRLPTLPARPDVGVGEKTSLAYVIQKDVEDIPSTKREIAANKRMTYFLIPPAAKTKPKNGYGLLVLLPGGGGGEGFHPFVKRIRKHAVPDDVVVAQLIATKWTDRQAIVWPTEKNKVDMQEFSTEEFIDAVVTDAQAVHTIDKKRVYGMGWSSSGPAIYAAALLEKTPLAGSYVMMSVYKPRLLPPVKNGKERAFYIEHSPDDRVCPHWMAKKAYEELKDAGARVTFATYQGGHGFRGNIYGRMKTAFKWLETKTKQ